MKTPRNNSLAHQRQRGSAVLVVMMILVIMLIVVMANIRMLRNLQNELKLLERQQINRLAINATNAPALRPPASP